MRIAVTGATGNIGVRLVERLLGEAGVEQVVGLARRPPAEETRPRVRWVSLDLGGDDAPAVLTRELAGVDVVVHLAWLIQPSHRPGLMRRANVTGSSHLLRAVEQAGVPALVHASSLGAYSPGPKRPVDESWATGGVPGSLYSAHKVEVERLLDTFQAGHPGVRVVRIRPTVVAQQEAAAEQARYFLGPLVPRALVRRSLLPVLPVPDGLTIQLVHAADIADLFARAALEPSARGAYNGAAEPPLDPETLAGTLRARRVRVPAAALRAVVELSWRAHLQPTDRGWIELALRSPLLDSSRAREELGWAPTHAGTAVLLEALEGVSQGSGAPTPVLRAAVRPVRRLADGLRGRP